MAGSLTISPLVDTTVIIQYLRKDPEAIRYLSELQSPTISVITEGEVYEGCKDAEDMVKLQRTLQKFDILPITSEISQKAIILLKLYHLGYGFHLLDAFIIATALVYQLPVVTQNVKHFGIVKELTCIAWPLNIRDNRNI